MKQSAMYDCIHMLLVVIMSGVHNRLQACDLDAYHVDGEVEGDEVELGDSVICPLQCHEGHGQEGKHEDHKVRPLDAPATLAPQLIQLGVGASTRSGDEVDG